MPADQSTDSATATTRRTFLARAAVGGALVTAGAVAGPIGSLVPAAGAQDDEMLVSDLYSDVEFGLFATPFELAAVQAYLAAVRTQLLDDEWTEQARQFGIHHQAVADTLNTLRGEEASPPRPDQALLDSATAAIEAASDQAGVLQALAQVEDTLAATHLAAVEMLREKFTSGLVTQVILVESQQAALLATAAGASIASATPAEASTDGAVTPE